MALIVFLFSGILKISPPTGPLTWPLSNESRFITNGLVCGSFGKSRTAFWRPCNALFASASVKVVMASVIAVFTSDAYRPPYSKLLPFFTLARFVEGWLRACTYDSGDIPRWRAPCLTAFSVIIPSPRLANIMFLSPVEEPWRNMPPVCAVSVFWRWYVILPPVANFCGFGCCCARGIDVETLTPIDADERIFSMRLAMLDRDDSASFVPILIDMFLPCSAIPVNDASAFSRGVTSMELKEPWMPSMARFACSMALENACPALASLAIVSGLMSAPLFVTALAIPFKPDWSAGFCWASPIIWLIAPFVPASTEPPLAKDCIFESTSSGMFCSL